MPLVLILARFYLRISFIRSLGVAQDRPSFRAISQEFPARSKKYDGDDISLRRRYWLSPRIARRRAAAESLMRQNAVPGPPAWKRPNAAAMYCMPFFLVPSMLFSRPVQKWRSYASIASPNASTPNENGWPNTTKPPT